MQRCDEIEIVQDDFSEEAVLFKALGDPHRLAIVATLAQVDDEVCVCDFTAGLPLNQPTVSHHLRILRESGLVTSERRGTWVYYQLDPAAKRRLRNALKSVLDAKVPV